MAKKKIVESVASQAGISIAFEAIEADQSRNNRDMSAANVTLLAESIRTEGLLQPLVVVVTETGEDGLPTKVRLNSGFRRHAAIAMLRAESPTLAERFERIPVRVLDASPDNEKSDLDVKNLVENVLRDDLAPYELAEGIAKIVDAENLTVAQVSKRLGLSRSHVGNLLRAKRCLIPEIWNALKTVREGTKDGRGTTLTWCFQVAALPEDEQRTAWQEHIGASPAGDDTDGDATGAEGGEGEKAKKKKPSKKVIEEYVKALNTVPKEQRDDEWRGVAAALAWARGDRKTPPIKLTPKGDDE